MSSPEIDSNGIKWLFAHGTQTTIPQSRDNPGDHRWSHDTPGAGKGYEFTWICTPSGVTGGTGGSSGHTALKCGGPNHSGDCGGGYSEDGTCCCWYDIGIRANGDLQFQTERPHPSNHDFDGNPLFDNIGHEMEGHSSGLKLILYPHINGGTAENGGIHIKFYVNSDALTSGVPNNNWRLAADIFDTGQILGDGYDWPSYQELEVRNSDTDESGFFHDSVYFRFLTDADLQALRSGDPGGGVTPPPPGPGPGPAPAPAPIGPGAVINTTYIQTEGATYWSKNNAEAVIKDTLNRQQLPVTGVDFANTLYVVIGPVDLPLRDITAAPIGGTGGSGGSISPSGGTRDVNISITVDLIFHPNLMSEEDARNTFQIAASEEMIEIQTDPFPDNSTPGWDRPRTGSSAEGQIGDDPCDGDSDAYSDGLDVEPYWSNEDDDCIAPGLTNGTGASGSKVTYHGGVIMRNPKIWMIFWGADWDTRTGLLSQSALTQDIRDHLLGTDKQYFDGLAQYDCGVPVWGGAVKSAPTPFPPDKWEEVFDLGNLMQVVADTINAGIIPLSGIDFNNTQFIVIPAVDILSSAGWERFWDDPDAGFAAYHNDLVVSVTDPTSPTSNLVYPEVGGRHDCYKPTINLPRLGGEGGEGGVLPPDISVPPPGATVINPIVSWAVVQVLDPLLSIIHATIPDWDGNNTVTRPIEITLVNAQVNTDQFARFGPTGWSRETGTNNQITETPCNSANPDNPHRYGDGLGVQAYWSNAANNCVVPGRGDLDLGTSTDVKYHGGRIMKNPLVVLIFWGPAWLTRVDIPSIPSLTTEIKDKLLDADKVFFSQLGQYGGCGAPQFATSVINTDIPFPASHTISLAQARAVVKSTLQNGSVPTALIDFNNTWFCVIPEYTTNLIDPNDAANSNMPFWGDVFQPTVVIPGTGGEDPGGSPDPGDLETFSGVLSFKRDINAMRTSSCAGTDLPPPNPEDPPVDPPPIPGTGGTAKFYIVNGTSNQKEISNESSSDNRTIIAEKINSSSSAMNGKLLKQADVLLMKETGATATTPLIYFKIWNAVNTVVYTSPTTFTVNSLTTSFVGKTFDCSTNTHTLTVGDYVGVEFTGTDPDEFIYTAYVTSDSGSTGSSGSYSLYKEGSSYDDQTGRRLSCTLWT